MNLWHINSTLEKMTAGHADGSCKKIVSSRSKSLFCDGICGKSGFTLTVYKYLKKILQYDV